MRETIFVRGKTDNYCCEGSKGVPVRPSGKDWEVKKVKRNVLLDYARDELI